MSATSAATGSSVLCPTPTICNASKHHRGTLAAAQCSARSSMARTPGATGAPALLNHNDDADQPWDEQDWR